MPKYNSISLLDLYPYSDDLFLVSDDPFGEDGDGFWEEKPIRSELRPLTPVRGPHLSAYWKF